MLLQFYLFLFVFASQMTSLLSSSAISKQIRISEDTEPGSFVINVGELLQLSANSEEWKLLNQKLLLSGGLVSPKAEVHENWFGMEPSSGVVTLREKIDRDELCGEHEDCTIQLKIFLIQKQQLLQLDVVIDDVNDNPPVFSSSRIVVNVSESLLVGDVILLDQYTASDPDIGENSEITYTISPRSYFEIDQKQGISGSTQLQLRITNPLDYETIPMHKLVLTAQDHGKPPLSDSCELIIKVSDVNDNDPVFEKQEYLVDLHENLFPGRIIVRVQAHDQDSDAFGAIRYSLSEINNKLLILRLLTVDPLTGDVILKETLDRESHDNLEVYIEARDSSSTNQRAGQTRLIINVQDLNDNSPLINIDFIFLSEGDTVYVPENTTHGTYIAHLSAKDLDLGKNGKVRIEIPQITSDKRILDNAMSSQVPPFNLTDDGFLTVNGILDREDRDRYEVTVRACDHGSPNKCTPRTLTIILLDENDHPPLMSSSKLTFTIPEDTEVGTILTTIHADDKDALNPPGLYENEEGKLLPSPFGEVLYHIIDGDGPFVIDPRSGRIVLAHPLDREQRERYQLTVRAKDGGREKALQSTCKIEIIVSDVNDNRPRFIEPEHNNVTYYATIARNHVIVQVQAVDYDAGQNGSVVYKITSEDGVGVFGGFLFHIDFITGELRLNLSNPKLNNSLGPHRVVIQAIDEGTFPLYSIRIIDVIITNLEKLPTNDAINLKVTSPPAVFLIAVSVTSTSIVLIIILVVAIAKCRNDRKQSRTYNCEMKPNCEEDWAYGTLMRARSCSDSRTIVSRTTSIRKESDVEHYHAAEKTCKPIVSRSSYNLLSGKDHAYVRRSYLNPQSYSQRGTNSPLMIYSQSSLDKSSLLQRHVTSSSHDGDSGRGDSDPDARMSDVTNDLESQKQFLGTQHCNPKQLNIRRNSRCTDHCLLYGHSDTCWMPDTDKQNSTLPPPRRKEMTVTSPPPNPDGPASDFQTSNSNQRHFQMVPGSIPHRHAWNYPANDLSAIYSDVVMNTQLRPESNYSPLQDTSIRHNYVNDDVSCQRPLDHCLPCTSPTVKIPYYHQAISGANGSLRRSVGCKDTDKRLSASVLFSSSTQHPLVRSSSADYLSDALHPILPFQDVGRKSHPNIKTDVQGGVSMLETQEIIDNIEKLLNS